MPPLYPFECPKCDGEFDLEMTIPEYDITQVWDCQCCDSTVTKDDRIICAASVTRASFIDGTKREGFAENREMLKLRKLSYDMKPEDRKDIKKTITEIERSKK